MTDTTPGCGSTTDARKRLAEKASTPDDREVVKFLARVDKGDACWIWMGSRDRAGYGKFSVSKRTTARAHRFSYELFVGPIPEGLVLDHLCRVTSCVNPNHLEPVTNRVNVVDRGMGVTAENAAKSHCDSGHPLTPENTYIRPGSGWRSCRECRRGWNRARKAAARAALIARQSVEGGGER